MRCHYFFENTHKLERCSHFNEDMEKRIVRKQGNSFLFPNFQRIPYESSVCPRELVREFAKEQAELTKKLMEKSATASKPKIEEPNIIELKKEEAKAAIAKVEDWGNWQPPIISSVNDPFSSNYGLRNTKQRSTRQENPIQENIRSHSKEVETPIMKKQNIPGAYIEDDAKTENKTIIPTKYKKHKVQDEEEGLVKKSQNDNIENIIEPTKIELNKNIIKEEKKDIQKIMTQIINKVLEQKINLTLEQILAISPQFINQLQNLSDEENNSINSINTKDVQVKLLHHHLEEYEAPQLHYACPLGFMQAHVGEEGY
ncbi:hypothetical protein O181_103121 [Austropuccinia psidii MF-1]|uniref:Uncharacterized protein n=1 Tax=Austropuccinia psidii MF-1 TaxID=1389203 RepID=A0A9Q3PK82_9BASI|nr:hypothetical protein [Austropuccinia psidii MF-1]